MLRKLWIVTALVFVFTTMTGMAATKAASPDNTVTAADTSSDDDGNAKEPAKPRKQNPYAQKLQSKLKRPGPPKAKPKYKPWGKVITKEHEKSEGFLTIYQKQEEVLLVIKKDQLDVPMLVTSSLSQGIGSHFVFGGLPVDNLMIDFHREEDHIHVRHLNTRFRAPGDEALQRTLALTFTQSIISSLPIISEKGDEVVVDLSKMLLTDMSGMSMWLGGAFRQPVRLSRDRNFFASIKDYPENIEIDTRLTYMPAQPQRLDLPNVPDPRYVTVGVQYSIRSLPAEPMIPRIADDRVGYFTTEHKDFTRAGEDNFFVHYANHWRLEKKDPNAAMSEPVKPIVFYMDRTIPEEFVGDIMKGVEYWQRAFEAAGFKNAIIAKRAPTPEEDPEYDPEDVRYNTIRWNTSDMVLYGAIGPSQVDPRTGEILSADILFEHTIAANFGKAYRRYAGDVKAMLMDLDPALKQFWMTDEERAKEVNMDDIPQLRGKGHTFCHVVDQMMMGGAFQALAMMVDGSIKSGQPLPKEFVGQALRFVAAHEVGHTLGLRHNFKSSGSTDYDKLQDKAYIEDVGMTGSVMDYPTPNISRDRSKQGYYYTPTVGTCDVWSIKWGYTPVDGDDEWEQSKNLESIASENGEKSHLYGTDEDTYPMAALDPRANTGDLSDDPMRWASERIGICHDLLQGGLLEDRVVKDHGSYLPLRYAVMTVVFQQYIASNIAIKNLGGSYAMRTRKGDGVPFDPVPASTQKEALDFILANGLKSSSYLVSADVLNRMQEDKMWSWQNNPFEERFDVPITEIIGALQAGTLANVMMPARQSRMVESAYTSSDPFPLSGLYSGLTNAIWTSNPVPRGKTATLDRNLQRTYTNRLIAQVTMTVPGLPAEAVSLSRLHLRRIKSTAETALGRSGLTDEANAHLMETIARINRALNPSRVTSF